MMNRPLLSTVLALGLGVAIACIVACGGAGAKKAAMMPSADGGTMAPPSGPHDQRIADLDKQISDDFAKLDTGPRPVTQMKVCPTGQCVEPAVAVVMKDVPKDDPTCKPGTGTVCTDTCKLANSICENAKKICDISKELPGDAWATGKCTDGETSCNTAHEKCCGCQ
jgi:hypothetical protein